MPPGAVGERVLVGGASARARARRNREGWFGAGTGRGVCRQLLTGDWARNGAPPQRRIQKRGAAENGEPESVPDDSHRVAAAPRRRGEGAAARVGSVRALA